ncbi:hypothetical protein ACFT5C_25720 [Streptomyces sp. NPDC057116]|uniref:hypothetical protein n=1 Tax=Streptomyces sp. NPDC057116 TaxID=3346023 RepID=UPI00363F7877
MLSSAHLTIEPTERMLRTLVPVQWVAPSTPTMAYLLLAHPPVPGAGSTAVTGARMRGLAAALHLAAPSPDGRTASLHRRFLMHGTNAVLGLDGCAFDLSVPMSNEWTRAVHAGAHVVVAVGLDPLPRGMPRAAVSAYLESRWWAGRILTGATHATPVAPHH